MREVKIIQTEDGSNSLFLPELNETYHSFHGALGESLHVFIRMGLEHWLSRQEGHKELSVFEVGFGTGLNALLALEAAEEHKTKIHYTSLEPYPLEVATASQLNYGKLIAEGAYASQFIAMHEAVWGEPVAISEYFSLQKEKLRLEDYTGKASAFDLVFFDAFAPSKQAELWNMDQLQKVAGLMAPAGVFTTYCAKGQLKRDLRTLGLSVETLPGAPGKKEMVRAIKPA